MKNIIENKNPRSASVSIKENKNNKNINQIIKDNEMNNNLNIDNKKGFHHRKRTSSYFLGSYLPDQNILESNDKKEYILNPNISIDKNEKDNNNENEKLKQNETPNKLIYNLINSENSNNLSLSFPSYDESNINEKLKKQESSEKKENKNYKIDNNAILEITKNVENSTKSFITFKNSLKYIKDKDERTTPSYQLALQADKKEQNNFYVAASNIIEEEKSSVIESKTEFSNKKEMNCQDEGNNKKENDKKILEEYDDINIINNLNNFYYGQINDKNNMSLKLNEIIIKNNKKEENRRKILTQNKMNLLNTFFTLPNTFLLNKFKEKENNLKKEKNYYDFNNNKLIKDKTNNNDEHLNNKKFTKKLYKKPLYYNTNSFTDNEVQKIEEINNLYNENNTETENTKKNIRKIPHLGNIKKINTNNNKNDSPINMLTKASYKDIKTTSNSNNSSSRNNSLLSKKLSKILLKNDSNKRYNLHSIKRMENLNNALTFIREKKSKKLNLDLEKKRYYNNNTYNCSYSKKINNATYTNSLTNSNLNTNNSNTQSHSKSKSKEKIKKIFKKSNSGSFNNKGEYISQNVEDNLKLESNKEKTIECLKNKLLFNKLYEKIDALEKISSTSFSTKSFFVILCENKRNQNQYKFNGLFKFYKDKGKFIKIYGDEKCPNYILFKDIKIQKKYIIFEDNSSSSNTSNNKFTLLNNFKSTNNAIILIKN